MALDSQSDTAPVIEAVERLSLSETPLLSPEHPAVRVLVTPKGKEIRSIKPFIDEYLKAPERLKGPARLTTLDSFIDHVLRCKDAGSAIFADTRQESAKLVAVYNYNDVVSGPRFGDHRAVYEFPLSEEWKAWKNVAAKGYIGQVAFAEFIEDRVTDVIDQAQAGDVAQRFARDLGFNLAGPQRLIELSRGLAIRVDARVVQAINLSSGESQFTYADEHKGEAGEPLKVPGGFVIQVPVFRGGDPFQIPVRLRYRAKDGVTWAFLLQRTDLVWDLCINEACARAQADTELPLFYGTPET
jgi:uncharacterized protein YfdQ (DUF2303 family)